jgi:hypothetical protein
VAPNQSWVHEANGNLHLQTAHNNSPCLVLAGGKGPLVELFRCKQGGNEQWHTQSNGTLCSNSLGHTSSTKCLSARNLPCDGESGDGTMQLWAMPQPAGAVALFILNNLPTGSATISTVVSLAELNYTHGGASDVFDVWSGVALPPLPAGSTELHTAAIDSYDSTFLLITPQAAARSE